MDEQQIEATIEALAKESLRQSHPGRDDTMALICQALHQMLWLQRETLRTQAQIVASLGRQ